MHVLNVLKIKANKTLLSIIILIVLQLSGFLFYYLSMSVVNDRFIFGAIADNSIAILVSVFLIIIFIVLTIKWFNLLTLPAILVIVSALSNIIDRFIYGGVVDYFNFFDYTRFNLADVILIVGMFLYLWEANKKLLK